MTFSAPNVLVPNLLAPDALALPGSGTLVVDSTPSDTLVCKTTSQYMFSVSSIDITSMKVLLDANHADDNDDDGNADSEV